MRAATTDFRLFRTKLTPIFSICIALRITGYPGCKLPNKGSLVPLDAPEPITEQHF